MAENTHTNYVLQIKGEMTIFNASNIREQLLQAMQTHQVVDVDMSSVSEFDTSGLQLMVAAKKLANQNNIHLQFTQLPEVVSELLQLSRMTTLAV